MSNLTIVPLAAGTSSNALTGISSDSNVICGYNVYTAGGTNIAFKIYGSDNPIIIELGTLPGDTDSAALKCCDEIIVGYSLLASVSRPFSYDPVNLIQDLPVGSGHTGGYAANISDDGIVIGGQADGGIGTAIVWVNNEFEILNDLISNAIVTGCSDSYLNERQYLCGNEFGGVDVQAIVWIPGDNNPILLSPLFGDTQATANSISSDGKYVVGRSGLPATQVYWDIENGTVTALPMLPGAVSGICNAISANGQFIVGSCTSLTDTKPFLYRISTGQIYDLDPDGDAGDSIANSVSNSGIAVGNNNSNGIIYGLYKVDVKHVPVTNSISLPCLTPCLAMGGIITKV